MKKNAMDGKEVSESRVYMKAVGRYQRALQKENLRLRSSGAVGDVQTAHYRNNCQDTYQDTANDGECREDSRRSRLSDADDEGRERGAGKEEVEGGGEAEQDRRDRCSANILVVDSS